MQEIINNVSFTSVWWAIFSPLVLIVIDVLTGLVVAWRNNNYQSSIMRQGLSKKFGELVYVLIGIITKFALGIDLVLYFAIGYICLMELSSLAENVDKLGIPLPKTLHNRLNNAVKETKKDISKRKKMSKDEK